MVKSFSKMYILSFLDIFLQTFLLHKWILQKNSIFCNFAFFHILKVEHKSFPMMYHLSYLDIKHGIQIDPISPAYPVFLEPSRDRVIVSLIILTLKYFRFSLLMCICLFRGVLKEKNHYQIPRNFSNFPTVQVLGNCQF